VDASDTASLKQALKGMDLLILAAPTTHQTQSVVETAVEAGVDYLDVQLSDEKLKVLKAKADEIKYKRLCFITEAGYHPGLPSAMIRYAAVNMDCLESALTAGYLNIGNMPPYTETVDELMECFLNYQAQVFKNGCWTKPNSYDIRKFDFESGIGRRDCYSMFFEELRALPEMLPALKETGFYISSSGLLSDTVTMLAMLGLKLAPKRGIRPMGKLTWWAMTRLTRPPFRVALLLEAEGQKNGRRVHIKIQIEHEDGYELTAIPVVALLKQYDKVRRSGLHMMGHLIEPIHFFEDMQLMGVRLTTNGPA
jgi:saccharopine dehydrogenase (NAD+, L-lysine-forming)